MEWIGTLTYPTHVMSRNVARSLLPICCISATDENRNADVKKKKKRVAAVYKKRTCAVIVLTCRRGYYDVRAYYSKDFTRQTGARIYI